MALSGRKWVLNHGKIWKKMSELPVQSNKRIIQEKQGKDKPERGADLGVRTV